MDNILKTFLGSGRSAFRTREYASLLGKPSYARIVLHRLKQKGEIVLVRNGWWAFKNTLPEAVACEISSPAYLSFHSALSFHGLTSQSSREVQLAVHRNSKRYFIGDTIVHEFKVKNFDNFNRRDGLLVASPAKAVADAIQNPRSCPSIVISEALSKIDSKEVESFLVSASAKKRFKRLIKNVKQE